MIARVMIMALALGVLMIAGVSAKIVTKTVEYKQGDVVCEGFLAFDDTITGNRPGIAVVHEWYGLNDYAQDRTRQLAEMGYVAMALDIYGKGHRATNDQEAGQLASIYRNDRALMRARVAAGVETLKKQEHVDPQKIAAIGFCFGGGCVLEYARSGADIAGVVSFHGNLDTPHPEDAKNIKCKVMACHGANDPYVGWDAINAFKDEMINANVNWEINIYGGAVHSFTNPAAKSEGAHYDPQAAKRAWRDMQEFFVELFGKRN